MLMFIYEIMLTITQNNRREWVKIFEVCFMYGDRLLFSLSFNVIYLSYNENLLIL